MTEGFTPLGYITVEQAVEMIGRHLMPHNWLGVETDLLRRDTTITDAAPIVAEEEPIADNPVGRLNRALNYLIPALAAGDLNAVVARADGKIQSFPSGLWLSQGARAIFRDGELPVALRVAIAGHKVDAGKRWVLFSESDLHRHLREAEPAEGANVEDEFRAWLATEIQQCPGGKRHPRKWYWTKAQSMFGLRLPYRTFNRIWSATGRQTSR